MNYNNDPLFSSGNFYPDRMRQLEEEQKRLTARYEEMKQYSQPPQPPQSPVWDEIDSIVAGLSDSELDYLNHNEDYARSSAVIQGILQREYLNIMRPIVERTQDGKEALQKHLELVKNLRKSAKDAVNERYSMLEDYMQHYSDISFAEYMDMKNGRKKTPKSPKQA